MKNRYLFAGALSGFLAVALGAFATHALRPRLSAYSLEVFSTGTMYQMFHALALLAIGLAYAQNEVVPLRRSGNLMIVGTLIFSGSLYALALSGQRWLGAITPLGGVCFLSAWAILAWHFKPVRST